MNYAKYKKLADFEKEIKDNIFSGVKSDITQIIMASKRLVDRDKDKVVIDKHVRLYEAINMYINSRYPDVDHIIKRYIFHDENNK